MSRIVLSVLLICTGLFAAKSINFEKEMANLAGTVTANVQPESAGKSVLILPLNDKRAPGFGPLIEQYLTIPLVNQGKVSVVDRSNIKTILDEQALQALVGNPIEAGRLSSANFMITGTVSVGFDSTYVVMLKLISTETSKIVGAASLEIPSSELEKRVKRN